MRSCIPPHPHTHTCTHAHTHTQMPVVDGEDKVVGIVLKERRDSGDYHRCYLVLDFSTHKLKTYTEEAEVCKVATLPYM